MSAYRRWTIIGLIAVIAFTWGTRLESRFGVKLGLEWIAFPAAAVAWLLVAGIWIQEMRRIRRRQETNPMNWIVRTIVGAGIGGAWLAMVSFYTAPQFLTYGRYGWILEEISSYPILFTGSAFGSFLAFGISCLIVAGPVALIGVTMGRMGRKPGPIIAFLVVGFTGVFLAQSAILVYDDLSLTMAGLAVSATWACGSFAATWRTDNLTPEKNRGTDET